MSSVKIQIPEEAIALSLTSQYINTVNLLPYFPKQVLKEENTGEISSHENENRAENVKNGVGMVIEYLFYLLETIR